jgi:uncharacterized phiE125 gp8 family phage protein
MRPHYILVSAPGVEPVSLDQLCDHLRVDSDDDEAYLAALLPVAREVVETLTGRVCTRSTWRLTADSWEAAAIGCGGQNVPLFRTPLAAVSAVRYYPAESPTELTTLGADAYYTITGYQPGILHFPGSPPALARRPDALQIEFVAGHEDPENSPPGLRHAIKLLAANLYENRVPVAFASNSEIPFTLQTLLDNQRLGGWLA